MGITIEAELNHMIDIAEDSGAPLSSDYQTLVKAFRLKHFGRCPACDSPSVTSYRSSISRQTAIHCTNCGKRATVDDIDVMRMGTTRYRLSDAYVFLVMNSLQ